METAASVMAVIQLAQEVGKGLHYLRELWKTDLPGRLESLSNQIADLIVVLQDTNVLLNELDDDISSSTLSMIGSTLIDKGIENPLPKTKTRTDRIQTVTNIRSILSQCSRHFTSLRTIVEDIKIPSKKSGIEIGPVGQLKSAHSWRKHLAQLNDIHQQINSSKASLILILGKETW